MRISDWSSDVCSSDLLSENSLRRMTLPEFREVAGDVHAMIEFSRRVRNSIVGLQSSGIAYTIPQKLDALTARSEEHTSELQSLMRKSYAVFCLKKKNTKHRTHM